VRLKIGEFVQDKTQTKQQQRKLAIEHAAEKIQSSGRRKSKIYGSNKKSRFLCVLMHPAVCFFRAEDLVGPALLESCGRASTHRRLKRVPHDLPPIVTNSKQKRNCSLVFPAVLCIRNRKLLGKPLLSQCKQQTSTAIDRQTRFLQRNRNNLNTVESPYNVTSGDQRKKRP